MSLEFSNTTTKGGILQLIERNLNLGDTGITADATKKAQFTADVNLAMDYFLSFCFPVGGTWQLDDSNHTKYPILTADIVSGQRDYSFTTDQQGNLILEIFRVMVADSTGLFYDLQPVDVSGGRAPSNYTDGLNVTGLPNSYDKLSNGIFLDPIPNYSRSGGLKLYINREASYFSTSDLTKKPGFPGIFHEYFALRPSYQYAYRKGLPNAVQLEREMLKIEEAAKEHFKTRARDEIKRITSVFRSSR